MTGPRRIAARCALVAAAMLAWAPVAADSDRQAFSDGLLWRISRAGIADSFVFGTIHLADHRVAAIAREVDEACAHARVVATEVLPGVADADSSALESLDDGRRLEPLIGAAAFARLRSALADRGVPETVVERLKPWAALMRITLARPERSERSLDERLVERARARHEHVLALESVDDQVFAFDAIPLDSQVALLRHALAHPDSFAAAVEPTIDAWLRRDLAALARIGSAVERDFPGMGPHYRQLTKHIIHDRTAVMHHRLFMPLRAGGVFVAVGASHLSGGEGLLAMLRAEAIA